ncbi:hypothetical protein ACPA0O_18480 [Ectopseudomonas chengduensis]|uniref:hypothetical protein n=1 Tax=Pseudomonas TaxID=286 RepID=UPI0014729AB2|nr:MULTISPECIES: hypothetical protein [Pseudomonas]NMY17911.1 hypothetical protein [Pseudomonas sp. WS 5019]HBO1619467.1 hypothetical protein [Pseudomonas aeruginosa]HBO9385948.1 hypothetical protein [Pseudomonas aeruginosa]
MNIYTDWLHGTSSSITQWTLAGRGAVKGQTQLHKALFFTTDPFFAKFSGGQSPTVYMANLLPGAHVLDISDPGVTCSREDSEQLRAAVAGMRPGKGNILCEYPYNWNKGWRTGEVMKYAPRPGDQMMAYLAHMAINFRDTSEGMQAWNTVQMITRQCIEDIVDGAIKVGYQAVAGHEQQDGVTYPILIVLDPAILTPPIKI